MKHSYWEPVLRKCPSCDSTNAEQLIRTVRGRRVIRAWRCLACGDGQGGESPPQPRYKRLPVFYRIADDEIVQAGKLWAAAEGVAFSTLIVNLIRTWVEEKENPAAAKLLQGLAPLQQKEA